MKKEILNVCVEKRIVATNIPDFAPVLYDIAIGDRNIIGINEVTAQYLFKQLGFLLSKKEGGEL